MDVGVVIGWLLLAALGGLWVWALVLRPLFRRLDEKGLRDAEMEDRLFDMPMNALQGRIIIGELRTIRWLLYALAFLLYVIADHMEAFEWPSWWTWWPR
jgi:hypothetical protein